MVIKTASKTVNKIIQLEKTLRYEVLDEICKLSCEELGNKIDVLIGQIVSGDLSEIDLDVAKATAKICSEIHSRRLRNT